MKIKYPLLIPLLAFGASLILAWGFLKAKSYSLTRWKDPVAVLMAGEDIPEGSLIDGSLLKPAQVPRQFLQPGSLSLPEEAQGQVTLAPILKGEQITATKLSALGDGANLAVRIPQGLRALSLVVDEASGVSGLLRPNDFVDLIAALEMENDGGEAGLSAYTLAQRVLVLAVGPNREEGKKGILSGGAFAESLGAQKKTVTLAVTPKLSQEIEFTRGMGKISLVLRPQGEEATVTLPPTTAFDLLGFKGKRRRDDFREYRGED